MLAVVETSSATPSGADLGKTEEYFKNLYGSPKIARKVTEFEFSFPGHIGSIRITRPFFVREFESGKLKVKVLYTDPTQGAIWVKYILPDKWTHEQLTAALQAYDSDWKGANESPTAYRSSSGRLADNVLLELTIYAPQLSTDLRAKIDEADRQGKAVPKF